MFMLGMEYERAIPYSSYGLANDTNINCSIIRQIGYIYMQTRTPHQLANVSSKNPQSGRAR